MNKIWPYAISIVLLISTSACHGVLAATSPTNTTNKKYRDLGLWFRVEYPSDLVLHKGPDNITLSNPELLKNASNYFKSTISIDTWIKEIGLSGMFTPPNLDTLARHAALGISAVNGTVTNKTKLT